MAKAKGKGSASSQKVIFGKRKGFQRGNHLYKKAVCHKVYDLGLNNDFW